MHTSLWTFPCFLASVTIIRFLFTRVHSGIFFDFWHQADLWLIPLQKVPPKGSSKAKMGPPEVPYLDSGRWFRGSHDLNHRLHSALPMQRNDEDPMSETKVTFSLGSSERFWERDHSSWDVKQKLLRYLLMCHAVTFSVGTSELIRGSDYIIRDVEQKLLRHPWGWNKLTFSLGGGEHLSEKWCF